MHVILLLNCAFIICMVDGSNFLPMDNILNMHVHCGVNFFNYQLISINYDWFLWCLYALLLTLFFGKQN